ncbi:MULTISPECIES: hypothetical protein [Gardnerella]|uniref:NADH dehydrogenase subunit K domain protein n=1 Tax=Gardnerella vaginalis TaxID=2702 RepID=A0A135Z648_GARVA|nr:MULTISPECIES: hypothetical protein [Gardnerella]KXI17111.1 NADH dehydrogenase subunit K domain protein [Gardnerella vaginalis]
MFEHNNLVDQVLSAANFSTGQSSLVTTGAAVIGIFIFAIVIVAIGIGVEIWFKNRH